MFHLRVFHTDAIPICDLYVVPMYLRVRQNMIKPFDFEDISYRKKYDEVFSIVDYELCTIWLIIADRWIKLKTCSLKLEPNSIAKHTKCY